MARSTKPKIRIDDLHLVDDGSTQVFHASWQEAGLMVELTLDIVALDHWQHGQYRERAYELTDHMRTVSGRPWGRSRKTPRSCFYASCAVGCGLQ